MSAAGRRWRWSIPRRSCLRFFYAQDCTGLWREIEFAAGALREFSISEYGRLLYQNAPLAALCEWKKSEFEREVQQEKIRREQQMKELLERPEREQSSGQNERRRCRSADRRIRKVSGSARWKNWFTRRKRPAAARRKNREKKRFGRRLRSSLISRGETQVIDPDGNRWVKCRYCGRGGQTTAFSSYGGRGSVNLGTCKICDRKPVSERRFIQK